MSDLKSWKAAELRELAESFRNRACETQLPKYIELLQHAAEDLEAEADVLEHMPPPSPGAHLDIFV
jgi:hypothetical protein